MAELKRHVLKNHPEYITSYYGERIDPITGLKSMHWGIDMRSHDRSETDIIAYEDGVISYVAKTGSQGNIVRIAHNGFKTEYLHMKDNSVVVKVGQKVERGEKIGIIGTTGRSTGIHLHFGVILPFWNDVKKIYEDGCTDPLPYLMAENQPQYKTKTNYKIQIGSFQSENNAQNFLNKANAKGYVFHKETDFANGVITFRIKSNEYETESEAVEDLKIIKKDFANAVIVSEVIAI